MKSYNIYALSDCIVHIPLNAIMDVIQTLDGGATSIACVVDHVKRSTYQEGALSIAASTLCVPGVLHS